MFTTTLKQSKAILVGTIIKMIITIIIIIIIIISIIFIMTGRTHCTLFKLII